MRDHGQTYENFDDLSNGQGSLQPKGGNTLFGSDANSENMMQVAHKDQVIEDKCTPGHPEFGGGEPKNQQVLMKQLRRFETAITLEELKGSRELYGVRDNKGNFHELTGDRKGQLACALHGGWRLIFVPKHEPVPIDGHGNLDWTKVTAVEIQELVNYH